MCIAAPAPSSPNAPTPALTPISLLPPPTPCMQAVASLLGFLGASQLPGWTMP